MTPRHHRNVIRSIASPLLIIAALAAMMGLALTACGPTAPGEKARADIQGAGATFPGPLYQKWIAEYAKEQPTPSLGYDEIGSGGGIKRFIAEEVEFGGSDAAMKDEEIAKVERGVKLIPATAGMVVIAANLPEVNGTPLKLSREAYVDIFLGKIAFWDDERITKDNPDLALPHKSITTVVRRDSSGTTYAFTNHLSAVSSEWRDQGPGTGKLMDWPGNAVTGNGNEGVARRIQITDYSIGYVEYGFAKRLGIPMAHLENRRGQFIAPSDASGRQTLYNAVSEMPENLRLFIPDPGGNGDYPIITFSWLMLYGSSPDAAKTEALKRFVRWGLTEGQKHSVALGYVPLPENVIELGLAKVDEVK